MDFNLLDRAIRFRWFWLNRNDDTRSWTMHPVKEDVISQAFFQASKHAQGLSDHALLGDPWLGNQRIGALMPELLDVILTHAR
jgi:hypothetical protein